jgi:hypothetical protein
MDILEEPATPCQVSVGTELPPTDARLTADGQLAAGEKKRHFLCIIASFSFK